MVSESMLSMNILKPPGQLDFSTTLTDTVAEKWCHWKQIMKLFIELTMTKSWEKEKKQCISVCDRRDIYNTMTVKEEETDKIDVLFYQV